MAHKTLIGGTAYEIKGGRDLIGGTGYDKKNGKVPINGTAYDIQFSKGIPLNTITPGAILMLNESGSPVPFYIAKHDYESNYNGADRTLLVRKDCSIMDSFNSDSNAYANSGLDTYLCKIWFKLLDTDIQTAIGATIFDYTPGRGNKALSTLQRAVFQLSVTELGGTAYYANAEGSALPIASTLQIAHYNGSAVSQWTRSPNIYNSTNGVCCLLDTGSVDSYKSSFSFGYRPAFTLPGTLMVAQNADGTYSVAA